MNSYKFGAIVFGIGFLIFLPFSILLYIKQVSFLKNSVSTQAVVIKINEYPQKSGKYKVFYSPELEYIDTYGNKHQQTLTTKSSEKDYEIGNKVNIRYSKINPEDEIFMDNFFGIWGFSIGFVVIDLGLLFFAGGFFYNTYYQEIIGKRLRARGEKVAAKVEEIEHLFFFPVDWGRNVPYRIKASWVNPKDGKKYEFKSKYLDQNPSSRYNIGSLVDVYIDPDNPKKYSVDTLSLV